MAHMIPPNPKEYDESSDEGLVFQALKTGLANEDDYYVFHSVKPAAVVNGTVYEREIDFVIAHPEKGILCIEAKNGTNISYDGYNRRWVYSNGGEMDKGGPYHQVAGAKRTMIDKISTSGNPAVRRLYGRCKVLHAVWFFKLAQADFDRIAAKGLPEEASPEYTMCAEDMLNPKKKIDSIFSLIPPLQQYSPAKENQVTAEEFQLLLNSVICPSFDLIPSAASKNALRMEQMVQMLHEQYKVLEFIEDESSVVINGAAGTGKTMIAVEKARLHSKAGEKVLFLCYNRLLRDHLYEVNQKNADQDFREQFKNVDFMTISSLALQMTGDFQNFVGLAEHLMDMEGDGDAFPYRHVIVDEGQDFGLIDEEIKGSAKMAEENCSIIDILQDVVLSVGGSFCLFYDKYQMVQGGTGVEYRLPDCISNSDCRLSLKRNCRNTAEIAKTSVTPLKDQKQKAIKTSTLCRWEESVRPVLHLAADKEEEKTILSGILYSYQKQGISDVVILTAGTLEYTCIADEVVPADPQGNGFYLYEYNGVKYRVSTCKKFKGLEAAAIVLIDLDKSSFFGKKGKEFYVGTSRAKIKLDMVCMLKGDDYAEVIRGLDPNAPIPNAEAKQRKVLGKVFSVDVVL